MVPLRRALFSVSDKRGLALLGRALGERGVELLSTGGTARALRDAGATVVEVADYTGAPEILEGRVKTLHPRIHGGLLGRGTTAHAEEMARHGIPPIDLLVVNLYPFAATVARPGATLADAIENIDIGGPSMIRSAAKNHERVAVVVDPDDYGALLAEIEAHGGVLPATRFRLARKAFAHTAAYDAAIANFLSALPDDPPPDPDRPVTPVTFPGTLTLQWSSGETLRYGENPHQQAALYRDPLAPDQPAVTHARVLGGKELSYNNLVDLAAALETVLDHPGPAAAIVKHANPCGVAAGPSCLEAYERARACDPTSAFGGVVALNQAVDAALAERLGETFLECVIAPAFDDAARERLAARKNLRVLAWEGTLGPAQPARPRLLLRTLRGGLLVQTADDSTVGAGEARLASRRPPTPAELRALDFAWRVCRRVKSNAIVLARAFDGGAVTVGIGAGQMSRIDAVRIAIDKACTPTAGTVLASDAFFPFRDGIDAAAAAGVTAVIHPGGSVRDAEVIAAADEHDIAMVLTGVRHFFH